MKKIVIFLLTIIFSMQGQAKPRVKLDLYYESKCPHSKNFIVNQLVPVYKQLGQYIELRLIPFGFSEFGKGFKQREVVKCHHEDRDCTGNKIHACLTHFFLERHYKPMQLLAVIKCVLLDPQSDKAVDKCMRREKVLEAPSPKEISECVQSDLGKIVLARKGVETMKLKPRPSHMPWIIINKKWTSSNQDAALQDLNLLLCTFFLQNPLECHI